MTIEDDFQGNSDIAAPSVLALEEEAGGLKQEEDGRRDSIFGLRPVDREPRVSVPSFPAHDQPAPEEDDSEIPPLTAQPEESASFPYAHPDSDDSEEALPAVLMEEEHDAFFELAEFADDTADSSSDEFEAPAVSPAPEAFSPAFADNAPQTERWLGIRFRKSGQVFFIADQEHTVRRGTKVLVEQENGPALGEVESILHRKDLLSPADIASPGKVLGLATAQDIARHAENSILAAEAEAFCKTCIRQRELDMKLVEVEVLHDRGKIIFYFTAPTRIDFRELVKDLVRNYRTRIELRQIGVRHETQMIGGLGNCGMVCCCHRYLRKFAPVTIKMAKEQNLFLNPAKLSGMCGRLLCCLSFEQGNYEEFNRRCPKIGKRYTTKENEHVRVLRANMFSQSIVLQAENGEEREVSVDEWEQMEPRRAEPGQPEQTAPAEAASHEESARRGKSRPRHGDHHSPRGEQHHDAQGQRNAAGQENRAAPHGAGQRPHKRGRHRG